MKLTAENQVKVRTAGGIEVVVKAINTHIGNADVCEWGCGALYNLVDVNGKTLKSNKATNEMNR